MENNIGEVLRLLRVANDLSITALSERTGISKSYITEIGKGKKNPSNNILLEYCDGLNISIDSLLYLFKDTENKEFSYQKLLIKILKQISKL